jgi:hypothetical protein
MYRKDLLKEWSSGHLASYGWYLDYPANNTLKLECRLKEKFEYKRLNKPTSIDYSFRGGKTSHNAKKLGKTKDQLARPSNDKRNEENLKQEEPLPNPELL